MVVSAGKVILDFYGNISIKEKKEKMKELLTDVRKKFNLSATEVEDFDDLERCVIGLAMAAGTAQGAQSAMKNVLEYIDTTAFARVAMEDTELFAFD